MTNTTMTVEEYRERMRALRQERAALTEQAPNPRDFPNGRGHMDYEAWQTAHTTWSSRVASLNAQMQTLGRVFRQQREG